MYVLQVNYWLTHIVIPDHNIILINKLIKEVVIAITFIVSSFLGLFSDKGNSIKEPIKGTSNNEISICLYIY